jgi:hypothetical protein
MEAAETPALVAEPVSAEAVTDEEETSPLGPVTVEVEDVETRALDEPTTAALGFAVPESMARAITPEIQVAEEMEASLSQGAVGGHARTLELACSSWATTTGLEADSEDDEEAAACHTLEHGMTWARRAFDELILPATSVSFITKGSLLILRPSRASSIVLVLSIVDARVFGSEACSRGVPTPRRADSAGDAACHSSGCGSWCRSERDVRAGVPCGRSSVRGRLSHLRRDRCHAAVTKRDLLASRLALAEAEIEKHRVAAVSAEEVAERAKTVTATAESATREACQTAAREKAALEAKVSELESDLTMTTTDLATTSR